MPKLTQAELDGMRQTQTDHMNDECKILTYSETRDSFGQLIATYTPASTSTPCGLEMKGGIISDDASKTIVEYDATLRLSYNVSFSLKDRIEITKRFGEALSPTLVYSVLSPVALGPSGIVVRLKKVET
jgi:hypothetical protein